jgi:predicted nucleic acid-binding protein
MEALFSTVPYLISTDLIWEESKQRAWQLRDRGIVTPWFDVVIATMAILNECRLYTADAHFHAMATCLPLRLYRPGYSGGFMED